MKTAIFSVFAVAGMPFAMAQNGFVPQSDIANRTVPAATTQASPGFIVKTLQILAPDKNTPVSAKARFHAYLKDAIGPVRLVGEALSAGEEQWLDSPKEWGQGAAGFAKRFGNDMAYNGVRSTITYGTSILFHEDDRYFGSGKKKFWARVAYAMVSPALAHGEDGAQKVSISSLTGIAGAAVIANEWAPPSWQGRGNIAENAGFSFLGVSAVNLVREFVPDIIQKMRK